MFEDYRAELEVAIEKCGSWLRQMRGVLLRSLLVGSIASGYTLASAAQATIHVPADQPTIQSGIDAAQNGDTVLVAPGTYAESLDFKGKAVTVTSGATDTSGASAVILQQVGSSPVVSFHSGEPQSAVLNGFTIQNGQGSGKRMRLGSITKTGNAHLGRIVVEAAWSYRRPPCIWYGLRRRQESISQEAKEIAWKAQHRLHKRNMRLGAAGKDRRKITTAVARELLGFIWAIGTRAESCADITANEERQSIATMRALTMETLDMYPSLLG